MAETNPVRDALRAAAEALGAQPTDEQLDRVAPMLAAALRADEQRGGRLLDLGETEPAFGLRFDVGDDRGAPGELRGEPRGERGSQ